MSGVAVHFGAYAQVVEVGAVDDVFAGQRRVRTRQPADDVAAVDAHQRERIAELSRIQR